MTQALTATRTADTEVNAFGHDKVARYGWRVMSERGEFIDVNKRLLNINVEVYQREGIKAKVLEISKNWSWISCGTLTVARRGGILWVVDGGHRKLAADNRSDIRELPCMVFDVEDLKDEARAFLATNINRRPVTALAKFKALLAAGDETARFVNDAVTGCGLRFGTSASEPCEFKAVALALTISERDQDGFLASIKMAAELAVDERRPVHQRLLGALYYINTNVPGGLDNQRLRKRILQVGMAALVKGADSAAAYFGSSGAKVCAEGMMQVINKGLQRRFTMESVA